MFGNSGPWLYETTAALNTSLVFEFVSDSPLALRDVFAALNVVDFHCASRLDVAEVFPTRFDGARVVSMQVG